MLVSGKRTDWQQYLLRRERCGKLWCSRACKGHPTTARPGTSNHRNLGPTISAADMGGRDLDWLIKHRHEYGLELTVPGERWHFEPRGTPTRRITPWSERHPGPAPTPTPAPTDEEFTVDKDARDRFDAIDAKLQVMVEGQMVAVDEGRKQYGSLRGWLAALAEAAATKVLGTTFDRLRTRAGELDTYKNPPK